MEDEWQPCTSEEAFLMRFHNIQLCRDIGKTIELFIPIYDLNWSFNIPGASVAQWVKR